MTMAVCASLAWMPRKSRDAPSVSASGMAHEDQCSPPSVVLSTVPLAPLAQAMLPSTESMPRRPAVVPESCMVQVTDDEMDDETDGEMVGAVCAWVWVVKTPVHTKSGSAAPLNFF